MRRFFTLHSSLFTLIIVMILSAVVMVSCKTKEYVPVVEHHTDTLRLVQHHRDSIYLHDSTFVREYIQGDTVRIVTEMWHTKFRDRLKTDTVYRSRTDSVPVPYPVVKEVAAKLSAWQKFRLHLANILLMTVGLFVGLKIYRLLR